MSPRTATAMAACLLATAASPAAGFAPSSARRTSPPSALQMSSTHHATEDMYPALLNNASLCAHSDTCSIDGAESYLREIVHIQSGCAAGTLSGDAVCDDVLGVSEVVADLREKIKNGAKQEVKTFWDMRQEEFEQLATAADGSSAAALTAPLKPAYLAIAALYAIAVIAMFAPSTMDVNAGGVVPFTAQEVWWAIRDGYIGDLTHHMFRNGGLIMSDAMSAGACSSLSPQEVFWSIRDGYAGDTMFSSGGGGVESAPFTPQEVWWAVQHGYSYDMLEHWFRNGGLSV